MPSLIDLFSKVRSWISWGGGGFSSHTLEFAMAENVCKTCSECELQLTDFCSKFNCRGCGRWLCGSCVRRSGSLIILATAGGPENCCRLEKIIKSCKFCLKASKRYAEKIYPSESPRGSSEPPSTCFDGGEVCDCGIVEKIHDDAHCNAEEGERRFSSNAIGNNNFFSSSDLTSPISLRCSPVRSDEETEYYEKQSSPSSEYDHDGSDVETDSISFSYRDYSCRSVGSSPLDSPSRINVSQPAVGNSVHREKVGDPNSRNAGPFDQKMAVLVKPEGETGNAGYTLSCADGTPILGKDNKFKKQLDFEKDDQIWFPPPPEDESDDYERNCFGYDDDDDDEVGDPGGVLLSSADVDSLFEGREKHSAKQIEPVKSVIHDHFRALVSQLLQGEGINLAKEDESDDWLAIISNLAWQAANFVKPDTKKGGSMDPGAYVKVKCVASGRPGQSSLIKGVVCTKNIKHKRMTSQYKHPRLLLLGGSLEYRSTAGELASFDTLLEKEKNHLRIFLARIEAHRPNVLLVEKSVSPYVQEYLLTKEISLVLNVKRHLLERIARCSGASIAPIDNISLARLGHCELFRLEKVSEDLGSSSQHNKKPLKTLMFFEGCPRRLGCTILLKGSSTDELKKVKHVIQYAVFAAYHLSLETSFLADEGASLPKITLQPSSTVTEHANADTLIGTAPAISEMPQPKISVPVLTGESPGNCMEAGNMVPSAESPHFASVLAPLSDGTDDTSERYIPDQASVTAGDSGSTAHEDHILGSPGGLVSNPQFESLKATAPEPAVQLSKESEGNDQLVSNEYFRAADDHQSILVSHSSCCVTKFAVCERSRLLRIKFYGSFDKPLGRYLRDDLFDPASYCRSCRGSVEAHVQCYTHQQGSLTINVRCLSSHKLPGQQDGKIWMWHRCLQCTHEDGVPPATHRVIMSDAAWGLSFGKFLELSFSNHATANRIASCGHSLQRDCLRFYGCGNMVACFHYIPIDILSVRLPPSMLEFDSDRKQDWLTREIVELKKRIETLYLEISAVLDGMEQRCACLHNGPSDCRDLNKHIVALKDLISRERYDYNLLLQNNEDASPVVQKGVDIMELNTLRHSLVITSHVWDHRFYSLDSFLGYLSSAHEASQAALLHAEPSVSFPCKEVDSGSGREENDSDLSQVEEAPLKTNVDLEPNGYENQNDNSILLMRSEEVIIDEKFTMGNETLEGVPSSAADLSAKIDSAWTGMVEPKHNFVHLLTDGPHARTGQVNPVDKLPIGRLKAPARVYSFDSVMRSREKLHRASLSSSLHLSAARSFHLSGDPEYTVGNPISGVMRTHSLISPKKAQRSSSILSYPPAYISCASHLAEGARLLLPQVGRNNLVIAVYDDEPTSIVSYALSSKEHEVWVCDKLNDFEGSSGVYNINVEDHAAPSMSSWPSFGSVDLDYIGYGGYGSEDVSTRIGSLFQSSNKSSHLRVAFEDDSVSAIGKARFSVTCYFARQFDMLRKKCCPDEMAFVRSLSRCKKWGAQGGKSNVYFAKSVDDRFIIKQVTKTELESFEKFAPQYFKYMTDSLNTGGPTCLAKILGIYQIGSIGNNLSYYEDEAAYIRSPFSRALLEALGLCVSVKNLKGGKESKMDLMVMENLFFRRNISRIYDLKGSSRSRYNSDKTGANQVLLDTNLLESLSTNPIFLGSKAKRSLERAVWNDTSFLASVDVMDYSLLVGVDEESKELVLGIIDFMRQYTWDKHLETWVKASGILGGPKNALPTIISPKQYKRRFRKAMTTYFLTVPDHWSASS